MEFHQTGNYVLASTFGFLRWEAYVEGCYQEGQGTDELTTRRRKPGNTHLHARNARCQHDEELSAEIYSQDAEEGDCDQSGVGSTDQTYPCLALSKVIKISTA